MKVTYDRLRFELDGQRREQAKDRRGGALEFWWGAACQFELGLFYDEELITDVTNLVTITVTVKPYENRQGPDLMSATVAAANITQDLTVADWEAGTRQHARVRFRSNQTRLDMLGKASRILWLTVTGVSYDSETGFTDDLVLGTAKITILSDGKLDGLVAPPLGSSIIPLGSVYSGAGALVVNVVEGLVYDWAPGVNDLTLVNGTQTLGVAGTFTARGATVTITGTASLPVTCTIRNPVFFTADQAMALNRNNLKVINEPGVLIGAVSENGKYMRLWGVSDTRERIDKIVDL